MDYSYGATHRPDRVPAFLCAQAALSPCVEGLKPAAFPARKMLNPPMEFLLLFFSK
jgi:hypothetical protein